MLNPLQTLLSRTNSHTAQESLAALEASPAARAALVQLFSSALRLVSPDEAKPEADKAETSRQMQGTAMRSLQPGTRSSSSRPSSSTSSSSPALGCPWTGRPTGPSPQRLLGILTACAHVLSCYLGAATKTPLGIVSGLEVSCVSASSLTYLALLRCGALEGLSRLLTAERNRSTGARLLTDAHEKVLMDLMQSLNWCACAALSCQEDWESPLCLAVLDALAGSQLVDRWAAHVLRGTAGTTVTEGKARGGDGKDNQQYTRDLLSAVEFLSVRLKLDGTSAPSLAAAAAARQVLTGRRLQYFVAAQAVSQLHAADGGPLYGLSYDALVPAVLEGQPGHGRQRRLLSASGLSCAVGFWDTCLYVVRPAGAAAPPAPTAPAGAVPADRQGGAGVAGAGVPRR